jgi:hypothetical protein
MVRNRFEEVQKVISRDLKELSTTYISRLNKQYKVASIANKKILLFIMKTGHVSQLRIRYFFRREN